VITKALLVASCAILLPPLALAKPKATPAAPATPAIDIAEVKDSLEVLTDGQQHYVVIAPWGDMYQHVYYGDGKRFHALRIGSGGSEGKVAWDRTFWEPRVASPWQGGVGLVKDKGHHVQCGNRATALTPVEGEARGQLLDGATFHAPLWQYRAYALARDDKGTYYYVDRPREPEGNKAFRLFAGPRGSMKPLAMTNVVSDSQGDIFTTKKGELRLVLDKKRSLWIAGKKESELVSLPIEDNHIMIYTDLGVYAGQRLGTPCDDLM
jgi:hypothetical protein